MRYQPPLVCHHLLQPKQHLLPLVFWLWRNLFLHLLTLHLHLLHLQALLLQLNTLLMKRTFQLKHFLCIMCKSSCETSKHRPSVCWPSAGSFSACPSLATPPADLCICAVAPARPAVPLAAGRPPAAAAEERTHGSISLHGELLVRTHLFSAHLYFQLLPLLVELRDALLQQRGWRQVLCWVSVCLFAPILVKWRMRDGCGWNVR